MTVHNREKVHYYIDACVILRFQSERKSCISPSETKTFLSLCDITIPTLSQWKISVSVQQWKPIFFFKQFICANKSVKSM